MKILVVDDKEKTADLFVRMLRSRGEDAHALYDGESAISHMRAERPDVVVTDWRMPGLGGMHVLEAARQLTPPVEVIVFTAVNDVETAVEAMRHGARDFLTKPVTIDQLMARVNEIRVDLGGGGRTTPSPSPAAGEASAGHITARSAAGKAYRDLVHRVAPAPAPVWIEGEIGSGRGNAARIIHHVSQREGGLRVFDLARRPDEPWPEQGSVLIPQVDLLPDPIIGELARRLRSVPPGIRLLATASPGPHDRTDTAWETVFYSLAVLIVKVPPLRERREDIPELFLEAIKRYAAQYQHPPPEVSPTLLSQLSTRAWPGNLRELHNLAERMVILGASAVGETALPTESGAAPAMDWVSLPPPRLEEGFALADYLEVIEKRLLADALRRAKGDRREAGRLLGVERNTLRYKLRKYDLLD